MSASLTPAATAFVHMNPALANPACPECSTTPKEFLDQCGGCFQYFCTNCICDCKFHADPADILLAAHEVLAERFGAAHHGLGLIIEDEYGCLFHNENVGALAGSRPVAYKSDFHLRLPVEAQKPYQDAQLSVWAQGSFAGKRVNLGNGWSARILPLLVEDERYTVTVFEELAAA